jgi:hypothetical protein
MEKQYIIYDGVKYEIKEPTIESWVKLASMKDWTEETEFSTLLISEITGLSMEQIKQADWHNVMLASQNLSNYLLHQGKEFHREFEFNDKKYRFINLPQLSFGEFVDIDSYLSKTEVERRREMNILAAMLYREVDENGELEKYDGNKLPIRAELFKKLPVKYLNGASSFFLRIEKISQGNIQISFANRFKMRMMVIWILVKVIALTSIGAGLVRWSRWRTKISRKFRK